MHRIWEWFRITLHITSITDLEKKYAITGTPVLPMRHIRISSEIEHNQSHMYAFTQGSQFSQNPRKLDAFTLTAVDAIHKYVAISS
jgi:hypothetical protein